MDVNELIDTLTEKVITGELKGTEQVVDPALFAVSGFTIQPMYDGNSYLMLTSNDFAAAQKS